MPSIGELFVDIDARIDGFVRGLRGAEQISERAEATILQSADAIADGVEAAMDRGGRSSERLSRGVSTAETGFRGLRDILDATDLGGPFADALGTVTDLAGGLGDLIDVGSEVLPGMGRIGDSIKGIGAKGMPALTAVRGALGAILGPVALIGAAALAAGTLIYTHFDKAVQIGTRLANTFVEAYNGSSQLRIGIEAVVTPLNVLKNVGEAVFNTFKILFSGIGDGIRALLSGDLSGIGDAFRTAFAAAGLEAVEAGRNIQSSVADGLKRASGADPLSLVTEDDVANTLSVVKTVGDKISGFLGGISFSTPQSFSDLQDEIRETRELLGEQLFAGNIQGAEQTTQRLQELERQYERVNDQIAAVGINAPTSYARLNDEISKSKELFQSQFLEGNRLGASATADTIRVLTRRLTEVDEALQDITASATPPFDLLNEKINETSDLLQNQLLAGDLQGAEQTFATLQALQAELAEVENRINSLNSGGTSTRRETVEVQTIQSGAERLAAGDFGPIEIETRHDQVQEAAAAIARLREELGSVQSVEAFDRINAEIADHQAVIDAFATKAPQSFASAFDQITSYGQGFATDLGNLGANISDSLANAAASFDVFEWVGSFGEARDEIAAINDEIAAAQEVLQDEDASNEERDAAREKIKLLKEERKEQEKKANVLISTSKAIGKTVVAEAKQLIKANIAGALSAAIKSAAGLPFPANIGAGAVAFAQYLALGSRIPKLRHGGYASGDSIVNVGEYEGANVNPEVITPLNRLQSDIKAVVEPVISHSVQALSAQQPAAPSSTQVVVETGGEISTTITGEDIVLSLIPTIQRLTRSLGYNPLITS